MPAEMKKEIDSMVKEGQYASVSEFFRNVYREWKHDRLVDILQKNERDFKAGKYKKFKSLSEID